MLLYGALRDVRERSEATRPNAVSANRNWEFHVADLVYKVAVLVSRWTACLAVQINKHTLDKLRIVPRLGSLFGLLHAVGYLPQTLLHILLRFLIHHSTKLSCVLPHR
jgi:hypothetical protein